MRQVSTRSAYRRPSRPRPAPGRPSPARPPQRVQRGPHALTDQLQPVQVAHRGDNVGGVGALLAARRDQALLAQRGPAAGPAPSPPDWCSTTRVRNSDKHGGVEAGVVQLQAERVLPARARHGPPSAACRSVRFSAICNTVTSASRPGDQPGRPRRPNASANSASGNSSPSRSRTCTGNGASPLSPVHRPNRPHDLRGSGSGQGCGCTDTTSSDPRDNGAHHRRLHDPLRPQDTPHPTPHRINHQDRAGVRAPAQQHRAGMPDQSLPVSHHGQPTVPPCSLAHQIGALILAADTT